MQNDVHLVFLEAANAALRAVETPVVGDRWGERSALVGYSVGGLAAHLCRAISTPLSYLDSDSAATDHDVLVDAAHYFQIALGDHDPVDSGAHLAVRQRSDDMAATGWMSVIDSTQLTLERLKLRLSLEEPSRTVRVFGGIPMHLDEYLATRIVELAIHGDDLAESCEGLTIEFSDDAWAVARDVVTDVAALRATDRGLVLSLSRRERTARPHAF